MTKAGTSHGYCFMPASSCLGMRFGKTAEQLLFTRFHTVFFFNCARACKTTHRHSKVAYSAEDEREMQAVFRSLASRVEPDPNEHPHLDRLFGELVSMLELGSSWFTLGCGADGALRL